MEKRSYSYGMKITGVLLHSFFTIVLTVSVFLLASLVSKNILELTDIGTDDFLSSGYYLKCMEQKCNDLNDYLLRHRKARFGQRRMRNAICSIPMNLSRRVQISATGIRSMACGILISQIPERGSSSIRRRFSWRQRPWEIICFTIWKTRNLARISGDWRIIFSAITAIRSTGPWKTWCLSSAWTHSFRQGMICGCQDRI